jgi:putative oxidoreductase
LGPGIDGTLKDLDSRRIPRSIAWLVIVGQSFGSVALVAGFLGRIAAGGLFIIFMGALIVHLPDGWAMNWFGEKKEEGIGIEYHVMLLSLLLIVIVRGSGAMSIDLWPTS